MTNEQKRILFVCTGNICRSPAAQYLAAKLARDAGLPWTMSSAGTEAEIGRGMTPGAVRALAARGVRGARHVARQLETEMLAAADAVYALTRGHKSVIDRRFPEHAAKTFVLREAAGFPDVDVEDPYGESDAIYEECAARIEEALRLLIRRDSSVKNNR